MRIQVNLAAEHKVLVKVVAHHDGHQQADSHDHEDLRGLAGCRLREAEAARHQVWKQTERKPGK